MLLVWPRVWGGGVVNCNIILPPPPSPPTPIELYIFCPRQTNSRPLGPYSPGKKWFDCAQCHAEAESHQLRQSTEMTFACKKCKKCFRKDTTDWDENDEYCPHCDNHFVIDAKQPQAMVKVEGEDARVDAR